MLELLADVANWVAIAAFFGCCLAPVFVNEGERRARREERNAH